VLDLAKLTAAPIEVKVGDKAYRLAPLTLGQLGQLEQWAREQILADLPAKIRAVSKSKLDKAEAEKLRAQMVRDTDVASRDPLEQARAQDSCAGMKYAFGLALRACQPVSDEELEQICSMSGLAQLRDWMGKAYGIEPKTEDKTGNPPQAQATPAPNA